MNTTELIDALIECGITFNATQRDRLKAKFAELLGKSNAEPSAEESEQFLKEYGSYANSLGVNTIAAYRLKVWLEARASLPAEQDAQATLEELERALCVIGVVGKIDGYDVIRRESVIGIARRRIKAIANRKDGV
jgi:putative N-acetylmannosamine-6-phosphate epimerase